MAAESRDAREILQPKTGRRQKWLVYTEVVGVAVDVSHWLAKCDDFVPQRNQERLVAVERCSGREILIKRGGIARVIRDPCGAIEGWIGLRNHHDGGRTIRFGCRECGLHPGDVGCIPRCELRWVGSDITEIVAGALDIQRGVHHATYRPAPVFYARSWARQAQAERRRLH